MPLFSPGQGLNSIRWRFALAGGGLSGLGLLAHRALVGPAAAPAWVAVGAALAIMAATAAALFAMAGRVTALIDALRRSTEAVASGDFNAPVDVDCACEIGGLATSFRKMTSRLNANVLRINTLAHTDPVTSLPNRSLVDRLLHYALAPERASTFRAAILFIDLDGFKRVNDTLGQDGGDELLRQTARRLLVRGLDRDLDTIDTCLDHFGNPCERLPQDVVFARFAGDEFVAIPPGITDRGRLAAVGERVLAALAEPFRIKGQEASVGASVGIAVTPDDTRDPTELLAFADLAMYRSKQAGKLRYRFFDKQVRDSMMAAVRTEAALRQARVPAQLLSVEITESMARTDLDATIARLPLDGRKIDRSLLQGIGHDAKREAIVRAIVGMTHAMGCQSIGEGIETEGELAFLRGLGCDCGQGFLLGRPMPGASVPQWQCARALGASA